MKISNAIAFYEKHQSVLLSIAALAGVVVAIVALRKGFDKAGDFVTDVVSTVTDPFANFYADLTHDEVRAAARIVLPSGQKIDSNLVRVESDASFTYQGVRYRLTGRRADNDYDAVSIK